MKLTYPACFYKDEEGSEGYAIEVPDLPGCASGGPNLTEAIAMITDAASGWILTYLEKGREIPRPSPMHKITPAEKNGFVNLIYLNIDEYAKKHNHATIQKSIEIPAYLNAFAESQHINYSQLLQEALAEKHRQQYNAPF